MSDSGAAAVRACDGRAGGGGGGDGASSTGVCTTALRRLSAEAGASSSKSHRARSAGGVRASCERMALIVRASARCSPSS